MQCKARQVGTGGAVGGQGGQARGEGNTLEGKLQPIELRKISRNGNGNKNLNQGRRSPLGLNKIPQLLLHPCGLRSTLRENHAVVLLRPAQYDTNSMQ